MIRLNCTNCGYSLEKVRVDERELSCPGCRHQLERDKHFDAQSVHGEDTFFEEMASGPAVDQFCVLDEPEKQDRPHTVEYEYAQHPEQSASAESNADHADFRLAFHGSAREYFPIWIVNAFLTVITLGVYGAWARVSNRQYLFRSITVDGHPFAYQENPVSILIVHMMTGAGILSCVLSELFNPDYTPFFVVICCVLFPYVIHRRICSSVNSVSYRNVSFRFFGSLEKSYDLYLLFPMLIPVSCGLMLPCWAYFRKKYLFGNIAYGETKNAFKARVGSFFLIHLQAILFCLLSTFLAFVVINNFSLVRDMIYAGHPALGYESLFTIPALAGLIIMVVFIYVQQNMYAQVTNYCLEHSGLGTLRFMGTMRGRDLFWMRCTNALAIMFSAGLLVPWARVRRISYILNHITPVPGENAEHLLAAAGAGGSVKAEG